MGRLAALAWPAAFEPPNELNQIPWGVLAGRPPANSKLREKVVPAKSVQNESPGKTTGYGQSWAQRLKRVFAIEGAASGLRNVRNVAASGAPPG